jgi:SAM-dependent methyltransferase
MIYIYHRIRRELMGIRRKIYGLRYFFPGLRQRHLFESMVGPLGFWDQLQNYQLTVLLKNGLLPDGSLLDIGCGPLQGGVAFIRYLNKGKYAGIDINPEKINAAHLQTATCKLSDKNPFLAVSSSFGDEELGNRQFDYIWASQILYYLNDEVLNNLMTVLVKRLADDGKFFGDILGQDHFEFKYPETNLKLHSVESINTIANKQGLSVRSLGAISIFGYPKRLTLKKNILIQISRQ